MPTIIERLADFTIGSTYDTLPADIIVESKRTVLDSIGCALAAIDEPKGRIGIEFGRMLGGPSGDIPRGAAASPPPRNESEHPGASRRGTCGAATIMGTGEQVSVFGAAFANAELINTLDYDTILPPGHVTPFVLPVAIAIGESVGASGKDLILATAISHEMSLRMGKAMDYLRDTKDGKVDPPPIFGYSSTILGGAAAAARLRGLSREVTAHAIAIAASIAPVNAHWPWFKHVPISTVKYQLGGHVAQSALTASFLAELGHLGDWQLLDDREFGFPRYIGTRRWEPEKIIDRLGEEWGFAAAMAYKPYPHCRIMHALMGAMTRVLAENDIKPVEIDGIRIFIEGFAEQPAWVNREIRHVHEGQFSMAHGIALAAHRIRPSKAWQDPKHVFDPSVLALMGKVTHEVHPDYVKLRTGNAAAQPARVEIKARGRTFVGEQQYPKGSRSPDPASYMTDDELIAKFRVNAEGVLDDRIAAEVVAAVMNLEGVRDITSIMRKLGKTPSSARPGPQGSAHAR